MLLSELLAFSGLVLGIVPYFYSTVNLWYKPNREEPEPREIKAMVLISRTPQATSGRHYRTTFVLTEAELRPTPPKPVLPPAPVTTAPQAAPARTAPPPRPVQTVVIKSRPRRPYTRRTVPTETVKKPPAPPIPKIGKRGVLDSAQRESLLEALDMREHLIDGDLMREVKLLVEGKITNISITPTDTERRIFRLLRIPGFE